MKVKSKRIIAVLTAFLLIIGGIFAFFTYNGTFSAISAKRRVDKLEEISVPSWITEDIIEVHDYARTTTRLSDIKGIVVHYVGNPDTSAKNNRDYFNTDGVDVSSHFIVGLDGEIIQCLPLYEKSAASNERNRDTISVEVCHPDETGKFNDKTYNSLLKLLNWLKSVCDLETNDIIRHYDVTGKLCPLYYVNNPDEWQKLLQDCDNYRE